MLIGEEVHGLGDDTKLHGFQILWTFRHYHYVGAVLAIERLAETAGGQEFVVDDKTMIVYKQDVDARFDIAVLKGIVEKDDVYVLHCRPVGKTANAVHTVSVDSHCHISKLLLHLHWLVAYAACRGFLVGNDESTAFTLIASAKHCHRSVFAQQRHKILHMGSLASATHRDVADRNDGEKSFKTIKSKNF